jgi:hypothetical protein
VGGIVYVGKESNRIEEAQAGVLHDEPEFPNVYKDPRRDPWHTDVVPALRTMGTAELQKRFGITRSTAKRWKRGESQPNATRINEVRRALRSRA